jgi:DNA-binding PadR family transcriptional regulator
MRSTRLFVLGALARGGPMHGHEIKRRAEVDRTEIWTDIKPGSLYGALHRLEAEGVIAVVRTEQDGRRPARTVYEITAAGRSELAALRDRLLRDVTLRPDPVDLALQNSGDLSASELRVIVDDRRRTLVDEADAWQHRWDAAAPFLTGLEPLTFAHTALRLRAEITWHEHVVGQLTEHLHAATSERA